MPTSEENMQWVRAKYDEKFGLNERWLLESKVNRAITELLYGA